MKYRCLSQNRYCQNSYCLQAVRKQDILDIKKWRNEQMNILRQCKRLSDSDQMKYYNEAVFPVYSKKYPEQILLSFLQVNKCIGYGGLTNIDWPSKRAELSFLLDTTHTRNPQLYEEEFTIFLSLIKIITFEDLSFNRLFTETFDIRPDHINILEKCGFNNEGRLKQHVLIDGTFVDSVLHGLLKEDYVRRK